MGTPDKPDRPRRKRTPLGSDSPISGEFRPYEFEERISRILEGGPEEPKPVPEPEPEPEPRSEPKPTPEPEIAVEPTGVRKVGSIGPEKGSDAPPSRPARPVSFTAKLPQEPKKKGLRGLLSRLTGRN
ncbi:MAG: hypothetical protein ACD_51C00289G0002 [uncultured bacterium]|nr:MAG: hypothetical protein ACD_51C00289G0002 [uncultured bacterium]